MNDPQVTAPALKELRTCSVVGCSTRSHCKGMCAAHYVKARADAMPPCAREGCGRVVRAGGLCDLHHHENAQFCSVEGCTKRSNRSGMCVRHYNLSRRKEDICSVLKCVGRVTTAGMCQKHYKATRVEGKVCSVEDCDRQMYMLLVCRSHYSEIQRTKHICQYKDCTRPARKCGGRLCSAHNSRRLLGSDMDAPIIDRPPRRKATEDPLTRLNSRGYLRSLEDPRRTEHRVVMERMLGRPLRSEESVHHASGDKTDNRPENLELWSKSQPYGQRVEDKLVWAREIIAIYGDAFAQPRLFAMEAS